MSSGRARSVLAAVEVLLRNREDRTDGELLRDFLETKTEAAFAVLVRRHGRMVWSVCERILGNAADADDAAQATFLVLATKANSLKSRSALCDWLHGIARRTALNARRAAARRREMERRSVHSAGTGNSHVADILPILDEELSRLPEKYCLPIVLCDLEGQTRNAAARQLRWPEGSVAGRLARGRQLLAERLIKRGVALTASALAATLSSNTGAAAVSMATNQVAAAAVQIIARGTSAGASVVSAKVLALTQGVLKTMLFSKLKVVMAVAIIALGLAWGVGQIVHETVAGQAKQGEKGPPKKENDQGAKKDATNAKTPNNNKSPAEAPKSDQERLKGVWKLETSRLFDDDGKAHDFARETTILSFFGDKYERREHATLYEGVYKIDPAKKFLDLPRMNVLYQFDGDKLLITSGNGNNERPDESTPAHKTLVAIYKRVKSEDNKRPVDPEAVRAAAVRRSRLLCGANLERMVLAMWKYHDDHGCYPPAATTDQAKKPLLSWRVALLPHLGEKELYDQFRQEEPWDSEHNHKLLAKMPKIYASLGNQPKAPHSTFYQVFVGEGSIFEPGKRIVAREVIDGTVNVLAIVTAPDAVPWTKPADLSYEPGKKLPSLVGGMFDDGLISFATAGAGVHLAPNTIDDDLLHKLIVRNDQFPIDFEALRKLVGE